MNVLWVCVCVLTYFFYITSPSLYPLPSLPYSLHPLTFSLIGQTKLTCPVLCVTPSRCFNLSSPLRAHWDLTQASYIWLVSTRPTAPHAISVALYFYPVSEKSIKHLQSFTDKEIQGDACAYKWTNCNTSEILHISVQTDCYRLFVVKLLWQWFLSECW